MENFRTPPTTIILQALYQLLGKESLKYSKYLMDRKPQVIFQTRNGCFVNRSLSPFSAMERVKDSW
jgi:hypothetical protein